MTIKLSLSKQLPFLNYCLVFWSVLLFVLQESQTSAMDVETTTDQQPIQKRSKKNKTPCIVCGKLYCSEFFLQRHLALHKLCPKVEVFMKCGYCGTQFNTSETYMAHMGKVVERIEVIKNAAKRQHLEEDDTVEPETIVAME